MVNRRNGVHPYSDVTYLEDEIFLSPLKYEAIHATETVSNQVGEEMISLSALLVSWYCRANLGVR